MSAQSSQGGGVGPSRKRRRQAVVCTECRRRKIACDRNSPCAQCIQSSSACTYYNSYSNRGGSDFPSDQDRFDAGGVESHHTSSSSSAAAAAAAFVHNMSVFEPRQKQQRNSNSSSSASVASTATATANYHNGFPSAVDISTNAPTTSAGISAIDTVATSWFDTACLGPLPLPLSMFIDTTKTQFPDVSAVGLPELSEVVTPTGMGDSSSAEGGAAQPITSSNTSSSSPSHQEPAKLVFHKSRLYGPSHWMTLFRRYEQQGLFDDINNTVFHGDGHPILHKCKRLAREIKSKSGLGQQLFSPPLRDFMPPREVSDRLVQLYLRTFESVLRILHVPTFKRDYVQYWNNPQAASESLVLQIMLVMAIGTCFYQEPPSAVPPSVLSPDGSADGGATTTMLHEQSTQWIHAAYIRLAAPLRKRHLELQGVQTQCLLVLALLTNTNAVGGDLAWITIASLVQNAMAIGLHVAPTQLPVSPFEAEIRRRLWATILELAAQASLDSGMQPVVLADVLDSCEPPSNLDDNQISESTKTLPASQPVTTLTQNSIQCALVRSLSVRLRIAESLSRFRDELPYDAARCMGAELTAALRETSDLIDSFLPTPPSAFQIQLQDLLARRFLLILHAQFAHRASTDVNYYFSRTVCLECSLLLLSPSRNSHNSSSSGSGETVGQRGGRGGGGKGHRSSSSNNNNGGNNANTTTSSSFLDDYTNLRLHGDGLFKNVFLAAAFTASAELLLQLREDSSPAASSLSRRELMQAIEDAAALTRRRIVRGETSVKAHVFLACVLAKTGTRRRSQQKPQTDQLMADAARGALECCCGVLEARVGRLEAAAKVAGLQGQAVRSLGAGMAGGAGGGNISVSSRPLIEFPESPPSDPDRDDDDRLGLVFGLGLGHGVGGGGVASTGMSSHDGGGRERSPSLDDGSDAWSNQLGGDRSLN